MKEKKSKSITEEKFLECIHHMESSGKIGKKEGKDSYHVRENTSDAETLDE